MQTNLNPNYSYLLACSFGPDSMALFGLLLQEKIPFSVAHINYQMRGTESEKETRDLIAFCENQGIDIDVKYVDGMQLQGNFQAAARHVRYTFFKDVMAKRDHHYLLTAHHRDDFLETYLMQTKSSRKTFFYGIKEDSLIEDMKVLRPLLSYYKKDLIAFCCANNVPYAIDRSNLEQKYTRNKIRQQVINQMNQADKNRLFEEVKRKNQGLALIENKLLSQFDFNKISCGEFLALSEDEKDHLLYLIFAKNQIPNAYSKNKASAIISLVANKRESIFVKVKDHLYFSKYEHHFSFIDIRLYQPYTYVISSPTLTETSHFTIRLTIKEAKKQFSHADYPLIIAPAKPGDVYTISGYQKTINRMYIDMKMPRHLRLVWPVVKNKEGVVIYVPRYRKDYVEQANDLFLINRIL